MTHEAARKLCLLSGKCLCPSRRHPPSLCQEQLRERAGGGGGGEEGELNTAVSGESCPFGDRRSPPLNVTRHIGLCERDGGGWKMAAEASTSLSLCLQYLSVPVGRSSTPFKSNRLEKPTWWVVSPLPHASTSVTPPFEIYLDQENRKIALIIKLGKKFNCSEKIAYILRF